MARLGFRCTTHDRSATVDTTERSVSLNPVVLTFGVGNPPQCDLALIAHLVVGGVDIVGPHGPVDPRTHMARCQIAGVGV